MTARPVRARTRAASDREFLPLISLLEEQVETVHALVDIAREKHRVILAQEHESIERVAAREAKLVSTMKALEERRAAWVADWASPRSIPSDISISELIAHVPAHKKTIKDALRTIADDLKQHLGDLRELNEQNAGLLYHSLAFTRMLLGALTGGDPRGNTYGPGPVGTSGKSAAATGSSKAIVDWRA